VKIFAKLFLLLLGISVVPLGIVGGAVYWRSGALQRQLLAQSAETGTQTAGASERALIREAERSHLELVRQKADDLEKFFATGRMTVQLLRNMVISFLSLPPGDQSPSMPPMYSDKEQAANMKDPVFVRERAAKHSYSVFHLSPGLSLESVHDTMRRLAPLGKFFSFVHNSNPWILSIYFAHRDGFILGYPAEQPFPTNYDPRERPWYKKAVDKKRLTWTELYVDKNGSLVITCAEPVWVDNQTIGVAAIDVWSQDFIKNLFDMGKLPASDAVLVNFLGDVRTAAHFVEGRVRIESTPPESSPNVKTFMGGKFAKAFQLASRDRPGVLAIDPDGNVHADVESTSRGDLYAYAPVKIITRAEGKYWYYIVRTPLEKIVGPSRRVRETLERLNGLFSESITRDLWAMAVQIWLFLAVVVAFAFGAAYFSAHSVTEPLLQIAAAVRSIGKGNLDTRVGISREDEVGEVAASIDEMAKGLKEGLFVKQTFKRYVAASVVDQLIKNPDKLKLGGERKELTVFFSDVSGFTSLSENLSPERLVELINEYLSQMTEAIFAYEGTLDKYEGDAIVAFWGAPIDQKDHALRGCKAALENVRALKILQQKWVKQGLPQLGMRIGLNTGPMVVGNMGSTIKMDYTVMGDAVNLGARLEGANKAYGTHILISEATRRQAGSGIVARELDLIAVKGKTTAVRVYELIGLAGQASATELEAYHAFESGLEECRMRRWEDAVESFRLCDRLLKGDGPSRLLIERVRGYIAAPPPSDWDGRYVLTEK
jgi:class 3 adenylate cyclase